METWLAFKCDYDDMLDVRVPKFYGSYPTLKKAQQQILVGIKIRDNNRFVDFLPTPPQVMHTMGVKFYYYLPNGYWANELSWRADGSGGEPTGTIWWIFSQQVGPAPTRTGGDDAPRHY